MVFFNQKKEENTVAVSENTGKDVKKDMSSKDVRDISSVLVRPHVTEKAVSQSDRNVYTFIVRSDATKYMVHEAVRKLFNVTPKRVNLVKKSPRRYMSRSRGKKVSESGMKKAYVYLKEGDSISLV